MNTYFSVEPRSHPSRRTVDAYTEATFNPELIISTSIAETQPKASRGPSTYFAASHGLDRRSIRLYGHVEQFGDEKPALALQRPDREIRVLLDLNLTPD